MQRFQTIAIILLLNFSLAAQSVDYRSQAQQLLAKMTLEEKAAMCSGATFWSTKPVERLGIPSMFMTDGPHGLRKSVGSDFSKSVPATCFPTASALASSWDPALAQRMGVALGRESQANDVQILLGPGVNMKRSPLGGRNFEYFSEDPILAGKMAIGLINGVQSEGVGTSIKHFAANSQELERMSNSSEVDLRTLHEIYFPAFEMAVKESQPWTVMCSYNRVNGVYASENPFLLDEILRKRWGFQGFVVSDWGAVTDRAAGVKAGLALEMPASGGMNDLKVIEAVKNGSLTMARLDAVVLDYLTILLKAKAAHKPDVKVDVAAHHALAREIAGESVVLLKNEQATLPFRTSYKEIAVLGAFAKSPRYQGAGSSLVQPTQLSNAWDALQRDHGKSTRFTYAAGYTPEATTDDKLIAEAVAAAKQANLAVIFAGLPDSYESEGFDRTGLDLPASHNRLIEAVAAVQPNVVVVLLNGSAVAMPWAGKVKAIVEGWLGGQAGGDALADVLSGKVNPSGKLSESFPVRIEDTPAFPDFPSRDGVARYGEGVFIGYRYYNTKQIKPLFPFGFGLSYTQYEYSKLELDRKSMKDNETLTVRCTVKNTGKVAGKEIVELYVHDAQTGIARPEQELKRFEKVSLAPGAAQTVTFQLNFRDFAYFDVRTNDWQIQPGAFEIRVGGASDNLPLKQSVDIQWSKIPVVKLSRTSMLKEFRDHPKGKAFYDNTIGGMVPPDLDAASKEKVKASMAAFLNDIPVFKMVAMSGGKFTEAALEGVLQMVNN